MMGPDVAPLVTIMPQKIMDVLMLGRCSHEFSWPRRGADGDYYQVCLLCAAEYKYDWDTMRRTQRVEHAKPDTIVRRSHTREKRPTWTPRARRLRLDSQLRYRVNNALTWYEGRIDNLSQTGLLFRGPQELPVNALIELVFEMPEEISGQKNRNVLCQGRVIRCKDEPEKSERETAKESQPVDPQAQSWSVLAATIVDYKFIH
jgi:PilZ domain-containing protein